MILLFTVLFNTVFSQTIRGKITDEDGVDLPNVAVVNILAGKKIYTSADGTFLWRLHLMMKSGL